MGNITNCLEKYGWIINLAFLGGYAAYIGVGEAFTPTSGQRSW